MVIAGLTVNSIRRQVRVVNLSTWLDHQLGSLGPDEVGENRCWQVCAHTPSSKRKYRMVFGLLERSELSGSTSELAKHEADANS